MAEDKIFVKYGRRRKKEIETKDSEYLKNVDSDQKNFIKLEFEKRERKERNKKLDLHEVSIKKYLSTIPNSLHSSLIHTALQTPSDKEYRYVTNIVSPKEIYFVGDDEASEGNEEEIPFDLLTRYFEFLDAFVKKFPDYITNYNYLYYYYSVRKYIENGETDEGLYKSSFNKIQKNVKNSIINLTGELKISNIILKWARKNDYLRFLYVSNVNIGNVISYTSNFVEGEYYIGIDTFDSLSNVVIPNQTGETDYFDLKRLEIIH